MATESFERDFVVAYKGTADRLRAELSTQHTVKTTSRNLASDRETGIRLLRQLSYPSRTR